MGLFKKNILYYPGCYTKYKVKNLYANYIQILQKLGIKFSLLEGTFCCGGPVLYSGDKKEFEEIVNKNLEIFKEKKINKIITNCPLCAKMFSKYYHIKAEHITTTISKHLNKLPYKYDELVTYFAPCNLKNKRTVEKILSALGFNLQKMKKVCCGAGGNLKLNLPALSDKIAKNVLSKVSTKKLIVSCPLCYKHLKENTTDVEILDLSEVIL